jgi:hypothetical protein
MKPAFNGKVTFAGYHSKLSDEGKRIGSFVVFRVNNNWFWQECHLPIGRSVDHADPFGPYPTAEGAYLAAIGD